MANTIIAPLTYQLSGADSKQTIIGTLLAYSLAPIIGYVIGGSYDIGRDLTGLEESKRLPEKIRNLSPKSKKSIAIALLAGLVALNCAIYKITPDKQQVNQKETVSIETIVEQEPKNSIESIVN